MSIQLPLMKNNMLHLLCNTCKKYLSVPPIYMNNGKFTCGRCQPVGDRVTIFEELAKYMTFPCTHDSCTLQLSFGQVNSHESNCPHKLIVCPKHNCGNYIKATELFDHFNNVHPELLHSNPLRIKRRLRDIPFRQFNKDRKPYMIQHENQSYLVMVYSTCKENRHYPDVIQSYAFYFGAFYLYETETTKTHYDLTVSVVDEDNIVTDYCWFNEPLRAYDSNEHCLGCLENLCLLGHKKNNKIFLWNVIEQLENEGNYVLNYSVNLVNKKKDTRVSSPSNSSIANKLECPICYEFFIPPIYICDNGHSLCSNCTKKLKKCALCKAPVGNSRNYTLEEIAESLEICCPNASRGCKYLGRIKDTKRHLQLCQYVS